MSFCHNCGNKINEGVAFCSNCGQSVIENSAKNTAQQQSKMASSQSIDASKVKETRELIKSWATAGEMFEYLYQLEYTHSDLQKKLSQKAPSVPLRPEKTIINMPYPEYKNSAIFISKKKLEAAKNAYLNSPEYRAECAQIDKQREYQQMLADSKYEDDLAHYENVTYPEYMEQLKEYDETILPSMPGWNEEFQQNHELWNLVYDILKNEFNANYLYEHKGDLDAIDFLREVSKSEDDSFVCQQALAEKEGKPLFRNDEERIAYEEEKKQQRNNAILTGALVGGAAIVGSSVLKSGGGSILKGVMGGMGGSANSSGGSGRQNYMGSASCMYGKKDGSGFTLNYCSASCPMHMKCTQDGRYKVGS